MPARTEPRPIIERKRKPDGSMREYSCLLESLTPSLAIVRFDLPEGGRPFGTPLSIPPGSVSYGFFWARRPYNLYRFKGPAGEVLGHRFDAVAAVRLGDQAIDYRDLVLDWWVTPDGRLIEEDRDEFESLAAVGALSAPDIARAGEAARHVYSRYRHIIDQAEALERKHIRRQPGASGA